MKSKMFFTLLLLSLSVFSFAIPFGIGGSKLFFENTVVNYGKVLKGSEPLKKVPFKNIGDKPLIITDAKTSCGCTVSDYPKSPIQPGETAFIEVRYDTNRIGVFNKTVTITTLDGESTVLQVKGEVFEKID
ncbi:MAG: hypothetical protein RLZZ546_3400 [Bacteroidota bacterium]|jgi:hypothetical protein